MNTGQITVPDISRQVLAIADSSKVVLPESHQIKDLDNLNG